MAGATSVLVASGEGEPAWESNPGLGAGRMAHEAARPWRQAVGPRVRGVIVVRMQVAGLGRLGRL